MLRLDSLPGEFGYFSLGTFVWALSFGSRARSYAALALDFSLGTSVWALSLGNGGLALLRCARLGL